MNEVLDFSGEIKVGNIVKFGNYFINDNKTKKPIEWRVLEASNNKALLITKDAIDYKPYNNNFVAITWEECSLRQWLNNEFINQAFSKEEQNEIILTNISNPNNPKYGTRGGNNTQDKIFLLSIDETQKYFKDNKDRECKVTSYAKKQKKQRYWITRFLYLIYLGICYWRHRSPSDYQNYAAFLSSYWWLRSPGDYQDIAAVVCGFGNIHGDGRSVSHNDIAVRPALYINL